MITNFWVSFFEFARFFYAEPNQNPVKFIIETEKGGCISRPLKIIDDKQLKALMRMKPTTADVAAFFDCSEDTVERHIKKTYRKSFAAFREENMVHTRFSLIRTALAKAEKGDNTMLIFCLKNICGWADKPAVEELQEQSSFTLNYSLNNLEEIRYNNGNGLKLDR